MTTALVDIQSGNLHSVENALRAAGAEDVVVTADPDIVFAADRVVLPGVGAFGACAANLRAVDGLENALENVVFSRGRPFLGICVGMQLMAEYGEEHGTHDGLSWIAGSVRKLRPSRSGWLWRRGNERVPHMGWNDVIPCDGLTLLTPGEAYFLHSYAYVNGQTDDPVIAVTDHGGPVTAAVQVETAIGVQFHPEKSQRYGIELLARFLAWRP